MKDTGLRRELTLVPATAINVIDMVGIGPFVSVALVVGAMQGPLCLLAWLLGAALAFLDGAVWSELGAKWPEAGGSYAFLQRLWPGRFGQLMAFLFLVQTTIQAPLVVASGAIGFSKYFTYLHPLDVWQAKALSGAVVLLIVVLLYRRIGKVGQISMAMGVLTVGTLVAVIAIGIPRFSLSQALDFSGWQGFTPAFTAGLGAASLKTIYCYLGYYNVCHLGAEIKNPARAIPRSMFISIAIIAVLYLALQVVLLGVLPWQEIAGSDFVVSLYLEKLAGPVAAQVGTGLVLLIAISSLFAVLLGYSRILYAAAAEGNYFASFARLHPSGNFPYVSLLVLGGISFCFSLLFRLGDVIAAVVTLRILVQFVGQTIGLLYWHFTNPADARPWRMWLFPFVPLLSICIWLFVFFQAKVAYQLGAVGLIAVGAALFFAKQHKRATGITQ